MGEGWMEKQHTAHVEIREKKWTNILQKRKFSIFYYYKKDLE